MVFSIFFFVFIPPFLTLPLALLSLVFSSLTQSGLAWWMGMVGGDVCVYRRIEHGSKTLVAGMDPVNSDVL